MAIDKKLFIIAGIITVTLFILLYSFNIYLSSIRERSLTDKMSVVIDQYEELQTLSLMSDVFGKESTCVGMQTMMAEMDKSLWDLGIKIDKYKSITNEYLNDPFYLDQKKKFNRREVLYYTLLKDAKKSCDFKTTTILFFYKKAEECKDCDAMSFVLTDLKKDVNGEVGIFSFDGNLDLSSIDILTDNYNITSYPCIVIEDYTYCGLHNKDELIKLICKEETNFSKCIANTTIIA
jgi:hypothetical protein